MLYNNLVFNLVFKCTYEEDNPYDIFSMKVGKPGSDEIVGIYQ